VEVAKTMVPEGNIVNAMKVAPSQQVMLRVRFLEVARSASREIGVNWFGANNAGNRGFTTGLGTGAAGGRPAIGPTQGLPGCGTPPCVDASGNPVPAPGSPPGSGAPGLPIFNAVGTLLSGSAPFGVALASLATKGGSLDVTLSALETKGLVRRLAEPDLVALSGDTAAFLAGGEFPVPTVQPGGAGGFPVITTEFKPFGVQLTFVPTVLAGGIINLRLVPSVSELDFTQAIQISGFTVPSLTKREARTTIELRDGQSFAIAGLLQARNQRDISQLPWIGSVPVLGALFRSAAYQQQETDLVVIVTPHLVAPSVPGQRLASPLDNYIPTNDVDFFLMGDMEQKKKFRDYITSGGDIQGPYGHMIRGPALPAISASPISAKN
jgi:pilus assembly protein CpaC